MNARIGAHCHMSMQCSTSWDVLIRAQRLQHHKTQVLAHGFIPLLFSVRHECQSLYQWTYSIRKICILNILTALSGPYCHEIAVLLETKGCEIRV